MFCFAGIIKKIRLEIEEGSTESKELEGSKELEELEEQKQYKFRNKKKKYTGAGYKAEMDGWKN